MAITSIIELSTPFTTNCTQGFSDTPSTDFTRALMDYFSAHHYSDYLSVDFWKSSRAFHGWFTTNIVLFVRNNFVDTFLRMFYRHRFYFYSKWNSFWKGLFSETNHTALHSFGKFYTLWYSVRHFHSAVNSDWPIPGYQGPNSNDILFILFHDCSVRFGTWIGFGFLYPDSKIPRPGECHTFNCQVVDVCHAGDLSAFHCSTRHQEMGKFKPIVFGGWAFSIWFFRRRYFYGSSISI